jgi:hypothetical protein
MPTVTVGQAFRRHVDADRYDVDGATVAAALAHVFARCPALRGYVLDDQGAVRRHIAVYIGAEPVADRRTLSDPVPPGAEIHLMQALSGG